MSAGVASGLWPHQQEAIERVLPLRGAMLAMHMGTGKSFTTIALVERRGHERILITCPKSVVPAWVEEFERHAPGAFTVVALKGTVAQKTATAELELERARAHKRPVVLVVNHESVWRSPFAELCGRAGFDLIVVDEIHRAKSPSGRFSLFLSRLAKRVPWRLGLTGTPFAQTPLDVYAQYRFLDRRVFGTSYALFKARYAVMGGFDGHQVVRLQNEDELFERFRSIAYQAGEDVIELPDAVHVRRYCALPPSARRMYVELEQEFYTEVERGTVTAANALTRLLRLQQVTGGFVTTDEGERQVVHTAKRELLADVLEDLAPREPVVVFALFHADLDAIRDVVAAGGRTVGELSGRANDLAAWQADELDVLAVQIQSGGVGINLTRARFCLYYSLGFSVSAWQQSLARCRRPGQTRNVTFVHLLAESTIDQVVYRALERKQNVIDSILRRDQ